VLAQFLALATRLKMKTPCLLLAAMWSVAAFGQEFDDDFFAVPPLSESAERSPDELEKLVAPMALYPDPLIAIMLPASVYPVEVIQAARFVAANNTPAALEAQIDSQPWDENVRALARFPEVIQYMSDNLDWTIELGEAFLDQPMDLMDAIQSVRVRAQAAGMLQSTPEQIVTVTNAIVERTYQTQVIFVTNTVVQVMPADPAVIYVPVYNPAFVFAPPPVWTGPVVTFHPGIRRGGLIANRRVNWWYGGVYWGPSSFVVWNGPGWGRYQYFPPPPGWRRPVYRPRPGWRAPRPGSRPVGLPPPGLSPGRPRPVPNRWQVDQGRRLRYGSRAVANSDLRGWGEPNRPATIAPVGRPAPLTPTGRPRPGPSRPGPPSRVTPTGRPGPGRFRATDSGLSDMNSGTDARDSSRRGASSRQNSRGPGNRRR
jgi:hypothetical protein